MEADSDPMGDPAALPARHVSPAQVRGPGPARA